MGITVRTDKERFTQWWPWDGRTLSINWSSAPKGEELYTHDSDTSYGPGMFDNWETVNVVSDPNNTNVVASLRAVLRAQFFRPPPVS